MTSLTPSSPWTPLVDSPPRPPPPHTSPEFAFSAAECGGGTSPDDALSSLRAKLRSSARPCCNSFISWFN
ncbi:hypothetical protein JOB18_048029 [Solea senegalensis]|uniref:Uncharacterized protein n=1 Tax=Solea senegalensis TaxID=28829 RepID=A0AAV6SUV4_SOLSE|nr:hypothetical protein JOB18_048029 [Solea senegalensis]